MDAVQRHLRRLSEDRRGNLVIEFALALPILLLLMAGLIDLGRYGLQKSSILQGAREGAQYGSLFPADSDNINATAQNATGLSGVAAVNEVFCECSSNPGDSVSCTDPNPNLCANPAVRKKYVKVTVTAAFNSVLGAGTTRFGLNGNMDPHNGKVTGWIGAWTPPTSVSASVTLIVP
jgi:Flp pilus assembly protein TadG